MLFTASDAYMRDLEIIIATDCVAATSMEDHERALEHMIRVLDVTAMDSTEINFAALVGRSVPAERD